jgi:hypothetical protein
MMRIYVDGKLDGEQTLHGSADPTSGDVMIGAREFGAIEAPVEPFVGVIHEVRLWSVARTADQISASRSQRLTGPASGLIAVWPLNDGSGRIAGDASGGGRPGELVNDARWIRTELPIP